MEVGAGGTGRQVRNDSFTNEALHHNLAHLANLQRHHPKGEVLVSALYSVALVVCPLGAGGGVRRRH